MANPIIPQGPPQPQGTDDQMMNAFQSQMQRNEMAEIIKELFDPNKIDLITDLTKDEVKLITRILVIADMKGLSIWKSGIKTYMKLVLSKNRMSRKEILEAIRGNPQQGGGFMGKMNPMNWGGGRRF